jgi:hypothetical protein
MEVFTVVERGGGLDGDDDDGGGGGHSPCCRRQRFHLPFSIAFTFQTVIKPQIYYTNFILT